MRTRHVTHYSRYAGEVQRYHLWPTIRNQTNAAHTWQVMRIWIELWGDMPPDVSRYLVLHDAGELNAGDLAHHVKAEHPELKILMDEAEREGIRRIGHSPLPDLSERDRLRAKACDLIEMAEFASEEQLMGNTLMRPVTYNIEFALNALVLKMCEEDRGLILSYVADHNHRLREVVQGSGANVALLNVGPTAEDRR